MISDTVSGEPSPGENVEFEEIVAQMGDYDKQLEDAGVWVQENLEAFQEQAGSN